MQPWVVEFENKLVAYADLQTDGYIDHFYVSGSYAKRGIGALLLQHVIETGKQKRFPQVYAQVSYTAQALFLKYGFSILSQNTIQLGEVSISNLNMRYQNEN